ncbi:hypothetical protein AVEN_49043-1 [Araneus ventricosus]|uniref:Mos1 transposase HTH domain-containing protein n=1 Tax=Araneus ventricosus TaxID=182803 RepID=A0A4Y2VJL6_ARAVE|nr:hypothetical protein AVEN_44010-1 [Araneus ventricosus]GBO25489.1 hypothetical protein AVEN_49043-1 [Araneus ventricosus]
MKEVYGEQCLSRCTIFRWCQRYVTGRVNIKDLPCPGQAHVETNSATISAVDEIIRQKIVYKQRNCASHYTQKASLWKSLSTVGAQASVRESEDGENGCLPDPGVSTLKPSIPFLCAGSSVSISMAIIYSCTVPHEM